jgi:hypothetical protein
MHIGMNEVQINPAIGKLIWLVSDDGYRDVKLLLAIPNVFLLCFN